jgi:2-iminobutanoate/2-iminopropanoate deaminase
MSLAQVGLAMVVGASLFALGMAFGEAASHRRINAAEIPLRPGAPYNQGVMAGDLLYLSGNIGQDPATGKVPPAFADEAKQALANLGKVLAAAGLTWDDAVKVNVYVEDMGHYEEFNQLYVATLPSPLPARTFLAVADIPGGGQVEIEVVAVRRRQ